MKKVVIGFLGSTMDRRSKATRWETWRPTVGVCQHEDLLISRFHLLYNPRDRQLAEQIRADIGTVSPETEVRLEPLEFRNPWDFQEVFAGLLDYSQQFPFDREHEEYLLHITTGTHVTQICQFLLTEAGFFPGKLLQTGPGRRNAPPGSYEIIDLDLSRYDAIARRFAEQRQDAISFLKSGIGTRNTAFNALIAEVEKVVVRSPAPLLLTGPTGAGKSRLARQIFELKKQRGLVTGRFVEVNCAVLRGDLALSMLFGHRKGAFTGATGERAGLLAAADRGVLFLDEVGELGRDEQAMLLQAIEEKRWLPVGSDAERAADFQLICGTNRDLQGEVARGAFRADLYARLKFWHFRLPGLAERPEDIEPNLEFEIQSRSRELGKPVGFSREAREAYLRFATGPRALWPANFRDLNNSIARLVVLSEGNRITLADVRHELARLEGEWAVALEGGEPGRHPWDAAGRACRGHRESRGQETRELPEWRGQATEFPGPFGACSRNSPMGWLDELLGPEAAAELDPFDQVQLAEVVRVCRLSASLAEAGRWLFAASRRARRSVNDTDRLRKYLQRFGLTFDQVRESR